MTNSILHAYAGDFTDLIESYQNKRRAVSNRMYGLLHALVLLLTACSICIAVAYAWGLGEGLGHSLILAATAVGLEVSLVFFAAVMYPRGVVLLFGVVAGVGVLFVSILTVTSFLLSQQHQQEHASLAERQAYRATLLFDKSRLDIANRSDRGSIAVLNNRIEAADREIAKMKGATPETKSTAIYHYLAKATGYSVEAVSLALRGLYGLIVVCTAVALAGYLETLYCPSSLKTWLRSYEIQTRDINASRSRLEALTYEGGERLQLGETPGEVTTTSESSVGPRHRRSLGEGVGVSDKMYQQVKEKVGALSSGQAVPVHSIRTITKRQPQAYACVDRLISEGIVKQENNGRYVRA